jgi:two-component system phosphate regulon sensor histidine kinase PhoR
MNKKNYKWVVSFISITIIITIAVQVYWNYREYKINREQLIRNVQRSLDNGVEDYYANLTRSGMITYNSVDSIHDADKIDTILVRTKSRRGLRKKIDSTIQNISRMDTNKVILVGGGVNSPRMKHYFNPEHLAINLDSLISKVYVSFSRDSLDLSKMNAYISSELERNNIRVNHALKFEYHEWINRDSAITRIRTSNFENFPEKYITTRSKSNYLPYKSKLELLFTNETSSVLRDSLVSILLSLLLSACIIFSLIYLLKTIYKQKQLAEIKNDLISNFTHEFKTPIATISTALEAMKNFNALNDKSKSEKYIGIANSQVNKLNFMVEKILETATLNHSDMELDFQPENMITLLEDVIEKYKIINLDNTFNFEHSLTNTQVNLDKFHFENAIGNLLDNAVKYGGNTINLKVSSEKHQLVILISDNGNGIPKSQKDKVFDQFYRMQWNSQISKRQGF